jgi:hypothetical protein
MYIKIVDHLDGPGVFPKKGDGDLVVAEKNHLYETDKVTYRKVRIRSEKEFTEVTRDFGDHTFLGRPPIEWCTCPKDGGCQICGGGGPNYEVILIRFHNDKLNEWLGLIAFGCYFYIMNDEGKTIDKLVCH